MRIRIGNSKKFAKAVILTFMLAFAVIKGAALLKGVIAEKRDNIQQSYETVVREVINGKILGLATDGKIFLEENQYYKKYSIALEKAGDYKSYNQSKDYIFLDLKNTSQLSLNSGSFKESDKDIVIAEIDGKPTLVIKKKYEKNNFVFWDELSNRVIILVSKADEPSRYSVVLDPGHGGIDPGAPAYNNSFDEKSETLKIQKQIRPELIFNGCSVFMSRDVDKTIRVEDVVGFTESKKPDVFISVHINSYEKSRVYNGIETYYSKLNPVASESKKLAEKIQQNAVKSDGWRNRGVLSANYYVIKHTDMPAVLVECGFASNPEDVRRLNDKDVIRKLAKNISNGILEYLKEK